ncbi:hypothetical protein GN244_ATG16918 [Phytophthora infestans]|uniref:Uncharacterized protein n=1 Tax=Phytophthora infestans TaxID=4787 RepID=A0A833SSB7_PHYIN|nr:hypothetical protein GN244_ATG16918 [Phytophthora infestans]KAF4128102.1 hypothetical protein GN958_ATG22648 [Phytophthora infestans]
MIASFNDTKITPDLAETMQTLVQWFATVSLWFINRGLEENEYTSRKAIGQLMSSIFGDTMNSSGCCCLASVEVLSMPEMRR